MSEVILVSPLQRTLYRSFCGCMVILVNFIPLSRKPHDEGRTTSLFFVLGRVSI